MIVYVLVVLSPAVTVTVIVFAPTDNCFVPAPDTVASLLLAEAAIVIADTLYGTLTAYDVVVDEKAGDNVPVDTVKLFNVASLLAFLVITTLYADMLPFWAVTITLNVFAPTDNVFFPVPLTVATLLVAVAVISALVTLFSTVNV